MLLVLFCILLLFRTPAAYLYNFFCRGFNDAINGFNDDGWSLLSCDGAEDVILAVNSTKSLNTSSPSLSLLGGVLCAKASMLLQVNILQ